MYKGPYLSSDDFKYNSDGSTLLINSNIFNQTYISKSTVPLNLKDASILTYSNNDNFIALGKSNGNIEIIDTKSLKNKISIKEHYSEIKSLHFSQNDNYLISLSSDSTSSFINIWDVNRNKNIYTKKVPFYIHNIKFINSNNDICLSFTEDDIYKIGVVSIKNNDFNLKNTLISEEEFLNSFCYSNNNIYFISNEYSLIKWNYKINQIKTNQSISTQYSLGNGQDFTHNISLASNGQLVLIAGQGNHRIYNRNDLKYLYFLEPHNFTTSEESAHIRQYVKSSKVTSNGTQLITISEGSTIRVYDLKSSLILQEFDLPFNEQLGINYDSFIDCCAISNNGNNIIVKFNSSDWGYIIKIPPLQDLIDETRERFKNRPLTPEERKKYYLE